MVSEVGIQAQRGTGMRWTGFPAPIHPIHPTGLRGFDRHEPLLEPAKDAGYRSIPKLA